MFVLNTWYIAAWAEDVAAIPRAVAVDDDGAVWVAGTQPANDQRRGDADRVEEVVLDLLDEQQPHHRRWQEGHQQVQHEALRLGIGTQTGGDTDKTLPVFKQHRQDRPQLDRHFKHLALVKEADQVADHDQVTGTGYRQKLGQALHHPQQQCFRQKQPVHSAPDLSLQYKRAVHRRPLCYCMRRLFAARHLGHQLVDHLQQACRFRRLRHGQ